MFVEPPGGWFEYEEWAREERRKAFAGTDDAFERAELVRMPDAWDAEVRAKLDEARESREAEADRNALKASGWHINDGAGVKRRGEWYTRTASGLKKFGVPPAEVLQIWDRIEARRKKNEAKQAQNDRAFSAALQAAGRSTAPAPARQPRPRPRPRPAQPQQRTAPGQSPYVVYAGDIMNNNDDDEMRDEDEFDADDMDLEDMGPLGPQ